MAAAGSTSFLKWSPLHVASAGPCLAHHVGCIIGDSMYVHGGIDKRLSTKPLNGLHRLDLTAGTWQPIDAANCPALSHHSCVVVHDRYMLVIGGWNGRTRISDVFAFDTNENRWILQKTSGFPVGAGLSSHTATLIANDHILVTGREGSLRMQRRSGNAFLLSGSVSTGVFKYSEYGMGVASRSGHTANIVGTTMFIVGGRSDNIAEFHGGYRNAGVAPPILMASIAAKAKCVAPMAKPPGGRKHHVAVSGAGIILIHGGETFDGRSRRPVGEMYVLMTKPRVQWVKAGVCDVARAAHVCCCSNDKVVIHGGESDKGVIQAAVYQLLLED